MQKLSDYVQKIWPDLLWQAINSFICGKCKMNGLVKPRALFMYMFKTDYWMCRTWVCLKHMQQLLYRTKVNKIMLKAFQNLEKPF